MAPRVNARQRQRVALDQLDHIVLGLFCRTPIPESPVSDDEWHRRVQEIASLLPKCALALLEIAETLGAPARPAVVAARRIVRTQLARSSRLTVIKGGRP
jgi:hypothetical protein